MGDGAVLDFMRWLRDGYLSWSERHFVHGYTPRGEAHHGTETHCIFLTRLWHLDPQDGTTMAALEDAAHHVGNWVEGIPAWYDWDHHRFRSWSIGTEVVEAYPPLDYQVPDHFKFLQFVLPTYLATGEERYLNLCRDYADGWCRSILGDELPGVRFPDEIQHRDEIRRVYGEQLFAQAFGPVEDRVELHVAGGSLDTLLDLYQLTGERSYVEAVGRMVPILVEALADPLTQTPALLIAKYRALTGDRSFDTQSMEIIRGMEAVPNRSTLMIAGVEGTHPMRIGRRRDEIKWGYRDEDGMIRQDQGPSPAALALAYQITGEDSLAAQALDLAARRLRLARSALRDGREHGCSGNTISAVTAGHGRAAGVGDVTATLPLLTLGALRFCGGEDPVLRFSQEDRSGLPSSVAVLFEPHGGVKYRVQLYADGEEDVPLRITPGDAGLRIGAISVNGASHDDYTDTSIRLILPSRRVTRVLIELN
jgi:hypothetical protein